eukprot:TRINITY_DN6438_c0_g4_i1.p1 TRINITY_DN6438_c0_g4~~TRINITY_DN6438_c0_g4_i1.p1  ORF type:complete len:722 (-),score=65.31 TRINITY_DN6438_c0_g4_i1:29-2194(-)
MSGHHFALSTGATPAASSGAVRTAYATGIETNGANEIVGLTNDSDSAFYGHLGIEWIDLTFTVGEVDRLKNLTGMVSPGKITAVMGSSGAGKTTLMNVLSGRQRTHGRSRSGSSKEAVNLSGDVFARGRPVSTSYFRKRTAYVVQDNALMDSETPKEALEFSAYLRLPHSVPDKKRKELVIGLIERLHLTRCADVPCGGPLVPGISGGELKRTAVGIELISNPKMLFLDEPLSGLDTYNAFSLMKSLKQLAASGVPVVMTLHQPSSEIYAMLDDVIFLHEGELIFQGPLKSVVTHFDQIGYPCPPNYNPADHILFVTAEDYADSEGNARKIKDKWTKSQAHSQLLTCIERAAIIGVGYESENMHSDDSDSSEESDTSDEDLAKPARARSLRRNCCQIQAALFSRDLRRYWRGRELIVAANVQNILVSLIYGWLFIGAGREHSPGDGGWACGGEVFDAFQCVRSSMVHWGGLSILAINTMMGSISFAVLTFQNERSVFLREASGGYYSCTAYFLSKSLFELPIMGLASTVAVLCVYWLMGLNAGPIQLILETLLLSVASSSIVFCISAVANSHEQAFALVPIVQIPQFAFAGILLPNSMVPQSLKWVKWICPLYHGMSMMAISEWQDAFEALDGCRAKGFAADVSASAMASITMNSHLTLSASNNKTLNDCLGAATQVGNLEVQGVHEHSFWWPSFGALCLIIVGFRALGVLILYRKSRFVL